MKRNDAAMKGSAQRKALDHAIAELGNTHRRSPYGLDTARVDDEHPEHCARPVQVEPGLGSRGTSGQLARRGIRNIRGKLVDPRRRRNGVGNCFVDHREAAGWREGVGRGFRIGRKLLRCDVPR